MTSLQLSTPNTNERLAEVLVIEGARAPIIRRISRVPSAVVSRFYTKHHGRNSPSGQLPSNLLWFAENYTHSSHGALLLTIFHQVFDQIRREIGPRTPKEIVGDHAFARTLVFYNREVCGGKPVVSAERAYGLIQNFADKQAFTRNAKSANGIKLAHCSCCKLPLLVLAHYAEYTCAPCQVPKASQLVANG